MRLPLTRTLFGRMVLVFLAGLLAAQLLAGFVLYQDRIRTLYHAGGLQSALRISEIAHLLEGHTADERRRLIRVLDTARLRISLNGPARDGAVTTPGDTTLGALFGRILRCNLGKERPMQVAVTAAEDLSQLLPGPGRRRPGPGMGMGRRHRMASSLNTACREPPQGVEGGYLT